jgi:hypothetical protein
MATFTYGDILKRVESNGSLNILDSSQSASDVGQFQIQQLQPIDFPMKDLDYESSFTAKEQDIGKVLSITQDKIGFINKFDNSSQILLNSNRIILNTKRDYLMLFGKAGVAVSSKNPINLDTDSSSTLAASDGVYLGVPNNGLPIKKDTKKPKTKGDPTPDQPYEPLALGIKAANIIEDLLVVLKNARIVTPLGIGYFREDAQYDLANLQARLPEILSTAVFIDGVSHESTDKAPAPPTTITNTTGVITGLGNFGGGGGGGGGGNFNLANISDFDLWLYLTWNQGVGGATQHYKVSQGRGSYNIPIENISKNWPGGAVASNGVKASDISNLYRTNQRQLAQGFIDVWRTTIAKKGSQALPLLNSSGKNRSGVPYSTIKAAFTKYAAPGQGLTFERLATFAMIENGLSTDTKTSATFQTTFQMNKTYSDFAAIIAQSAVGTSTYRDNFTEYNIDTLTRLTVPKIINYYQSFVKNSGYGASA